MKYIVFLAIVMSFLSCNSDEGRDDCSGTRLSCAVPSFALQFLNEDGEDVFLNETYSPGDIEVTSRAQNCEVTQLDFYIDPGATGFFLALNGDGCSQSRESYTIKLDSVFDFDVTFNRNTVASSNSCCPTVRITEVTFEGISGVKTGDDFNFFYAVALD